MSFFEIGCGEGRVLAYPVAKGVENFIGIDPDNVSSDVGPHAVAAHYRQLGVEVFLASGAEGQKFDRVLMIDVLEHYSVEETIQLFRSLRPYLSDATKLLVRVPNSASPWGQQFHYGDLTHKSAYTPDSMRQLAKAANYHCLHCFPHRLGSPRRQLTERIMHGFLGWCVGTPLEIWTANFCAVLEPRTRS